MIVFVIQAIPVFGLRTGQEPGQGVVWTLQEDQGSPDNINYWALRHLIRQRSGHIGWKCGHILRGAHDDAK